MAYDLAIIGAGPGGYVAAIRAAQLGKKVALIERDRVGGVCLNRGCIPTKAMISSAHALHAVRSAADFGIDLPAGEATVDMAKIAARRDRIVAQLRGGVAALLKGNGVELISGTASFVSKGILDVNGNEIEAGKILIATGSSWMELPDLKIDGRRIVTTDEALGWTSVPPRLLIVGGGVIGCEFACMMQTFGSKVTIVEATPSILPFVEKAISRLLDRSMKGRGIEILTSTMVKGAVVQGNEVKISLSSGEERLADCVLVGVGRRPFTEGLELERAGVLLTERGFIKVDENFQTSAEGVFAIGDVIGAPMLAHAASAEGIAAVERMFSGLGTRDSVLGYNPLYCPSPIFTMPEIACVGQTSEGLEQKGIKFKTGRFAYAANGKALCDGDTEGQAIVHSDADGKILGVHVTGHDATLLMAEAVLAMRKGLAAKDFASSIHSHPTLSEVVAEAAEDVDGRAIHKAPARRKE
ncbi:MAG: dihydrolipoyl dehydrogenase [Pseudomonadota bacterium]